MINYLASLAQRAANPVTDVEPSMPSTFAGQVPRQARRDTQDWITEDTVFESPEFGSSALAPPSEPNFRIAQNLHPAAPVAAASFTDSIQHPDSIPRRPSDVPVITQTSMPQFEPVGIERPTTRVERAPAPAAVVPQTNRAIPSDPVVARAANLRFSVDRSIDKSRQLPDARSETSSAIAPILPDRVISMPLAAEPPRSSARETAAIAKVRDGQPDRAREQRESEWPSIEPKIVRRITEVIPVATTRPSPASMQRMQSAPVATVQETIVQVTIGRVEVRATTPSRPVTSRDSAIRSTQGLDDFLRGRSS